MSEQALGDDALEGTEDLGDQDGVAEGASVDDGSIGGLSVEEQATLAGWNPEHPGGKTAEEFLARNQEHLGLQRKENEKLYGEIGGLKQKLDEMNASQELMVKFLENKKHQDEQAGYDRAIRAAQSEMEQAVEDADTDKFNAAKNKAEQYMKAKEEHKVESILPEKPDPNSGVEQLKKLVNDHFESSPPEMFDLASKKEVWIKELRSQFQSGVDPEQAKKLADKAVVQMFNLQRSMPGLNEGGKGGSNVAKRLADIPGAQQAYNTLKKKIPELTVEEYLEGIQ